MEKLSVIVTGGASGIGREVALRLASAGHPLIILDAQADKIDAAVAECRTRSGTKAAGFAVDVTDRAALAAAIDEGESACGPVGILAACAGIARQAEFAALAQPDWERVLAVNLGGVLSSARIVADRMIARGTRGRIVMIASRGILGDRGYLHYVVSKAGVVGAARALALKLAPHGITVNTVAPGFVETPMTMSVRGPEVTKAVAALTPLQRNAQPADVAAAMTFLASPEASFVTGQNFFICGGRSLLPTIAGAGRSDA